MMAERERLFPFERVFNFRDLGGYRTRDGRTVRWRRLFRSGELQRMSEAEAERVRGELGIVTVLDFRTDEEADHPIGLGPLLASPVVRHQFAMGDPRAKFRARETGEWRPRFTRTLEGGAEHWVRAIQLLAEEETYPAVFHCVTGKDRTGVLAALVLGVAGVDEETIVEDYALSQREMDRLVRQLRDRGVIGSDEPQNPALAVVPEAMREMLGDLRDEHGSARDFLRAGGVEDATLDRLRDLLLE